MALVGVAISLALSSAGCSISYKLDGFTKKDPADKSERTGSIPDASATAKLAGAVVEADLPYAKAAIDQALVQPERDVSIPWESPRTGARGTVTPLAAAYVENGLTCRDFLASVVSKTGESWFQGGACRINQGRWEVRTVRARTKETG